MAAGAAASAAMASAPLLGALVAALLLVAVHAGSPVSIVSTDPLLPDPPRHVWRTSGDAAPEDAAAAAPVASFSAGAAARAGAPPAATRRRLRQVFASQVSPATPAPTLQQVSGAAGSYALAPGAFAGSGNQSFALAPSAT